MQLLKLITMRVICIDNKARAHSVDKDALKRLQEGKVYTAYEADHPDGYLLSEVSTFNPCGFCKSRFIPCSDIDERERMYEVQINEKPHRVTSV